MTASPLRLRPSILLWFIALAGVSASPGQEPLFLNKTSAYWLDKLSSPDARRRRSAAFALGKLGSDGFAAVPTLIRTLDDPDESVADAAAWALGDMSSWAITAVPALEKVLMDRQRGARVRRSAAYALGKIGPGKESSIQALIQALDDDHAEVRQNAAWALGRLGPKASETVVRALQAKLADDDDLVRLDAATGLGLIGKNARPALPDIRGRLEREDNIVVRRALLHALVNLVGSKDTEAIPALRKVLQGSDRESARAAALALGNIGGSEAKDAVPYLRKILGHSQAGLRQSAAGGLANIGRASAGAVPELIRALADNEAPVRMLAALALARIGPAAKDAVPHLIRLLHPKEPEKVRRFAAEAVSRIHHDIKSAVPALLLLLQNDPSPSVRHRAVWALGRVKDFEGSKAAEGLEKILEDKSIELTIVRYEAARYLALGLGPKTPDKAIDVLGAMLHDPYLQVYRRTDAQVRSKGAESGGGRANDQAVRGGDGRYLPCQALALIGPRANRPNIMKGLRMAEKSADPRLQKAAKEALKKIQPSKQGMGDS